MAKDMPIEDLLSWVSVDPENGRVFWNYRHDRSVHWNSQRGGKRAGGLNSQGYWSIRICGTLYREHHIVWRVAKGRWPEEIDHIDGDRLNNRIENLREVTRSENLKNKALSRRNRSGCHGVSFYKSAGKWCARESGASSRQIGLFDNLKDAIAARKKYERENGFHPNHGKREASYGNR